MLTMVITVINPTPPVCMSRSITICPNTEKCTFVLYTTSPVTQVALVAVKSESINGVQLPSLLETGRQSRNAPVKITTTYPSTRNLAAVSFRLFLDMLIIILSAVQRVSQRDARFRV